MCSSVAEVSDDLCAEAVCSDVECVSGEELGCGAGQWEVCDAEYVEADCGYVYVCSVLG